MTFAPALLPSSVPPRHRVWARRRRAGVTALLAALTLLLALPGVALAHAAVEGTFPADGSVVQQAPAEVSITFNEGVSVPTAGLRVFDSSGERIDLGDADVDPDNPGRARVSVPADADEGTYVVTWRATSADGHPVKGAFVYSVLTDEGVGDDLVGALFSGGEDTFVVLASVLLNALALLAVLLAAGFVAFQRLVDGGAAGVLRTALRRAMQLGLVATLVELPIQSMRVTGFGLVQALGPEPMLDLLGSPTGWSALLRAVALAMALRISRAGGPAAVGADPDADTDDTDPAEGGEPVGAAARPAPSAWLAVAVLIALLSHALAGHSLTQRPIPVMFAGAVVHLLAAAVWFGGLVAVAVVLRQRRRADDPVGAARVVAGFSRVATIALVGVWVAGSSMAWVTVRQVRALTSTDYGWTLLAKVVLVVVAIVIGLYNNRQLVPAVAAAAHVPPDSREGRIGDLGWQRLSGTVRVEAALLVVVVLATGLLVGLQPAAQEAGITGAFSTYTSLGEDLEINLVVDPNRAGVNEMHVYVLTPQGRVADTVEDVRLELEHVDRGIGPIERAPLVSGPGHWVLTGRDLSIPGRWAVTVHALTGRFTEETTTIEVVVN